jgi:hypothetical protein
MCNGQLNIFFLSAPPSGTVSWDPSTTAGFQTTGTATLPEPAALLVFGTGLMAWFGVPRTKRLRRAWSLIG